jgi:NAD(P)-dependent dehydrogenase (short-subunit alcohol dehydrogenase family)
MVEAGDLHQSLPEQRSPKLAMPGAVGPGFAKIRGRNPMNRLDGRVALISGAARGIGAETAKLMIEAGARVAIGDVLDDRGREIARAFGDNALYHHLDVTREDDWNETVAATVARFGGIDILVNNAGMFLGKGIEEASLDEWHRLAGINLTGVFLGTKLTLPALRERAQHGEHGSAIVNLASVAGLVGSQLDPLYSMTKGGVTLFTKSAALEFARKGYRIRVNSIHPGVIQTPPRPTHSLRPSLPSPTSRVQVEYLACTRTCSAARHASGQNPTLGAVRMSAPGGTPAIRARGTAVGYTPKAAARDRNHGTFGYRYCG